MSVNRYISHLPCELAVTRTLLPTGRPSGFNPALLGTSASALVLEL